MDVKKLSHNLFDLLNKIKLFCNSEKTVVSKKFFLTDQNLYFSILLSWGFYLGDDILHFLHKINPTIKLITINTATTIPMIRPTFDPEFSS